MATKVPVQFDLDELMRRLDGAMTRADAHNAEVVPIDRTTWVMARSLCDAHQRNQELLHRIAVARRGDCPDVDESPERLPDEIEEMWQRIEELRPEEMV